MNTYISVLSTNDYLPGVLVVNKCLKLTKAQFPFTVLVTDNISCNTISILEKNNIQIKHIENIFFKNHKIDKWYYTFSKLCIFVQIEFEKIVYIDLDMVITENLDHLFKKPHFSSVNAGGFIHKDWIELNSGLIVFKPSIEIYNKLINLLQDGSYYPGDQNVLHKYYNEWPSKKELNLGYQYNMFVDHIPRAIKELNFTTINSMDEINADTKNNNNIKVFHYINPKPWKKIEHNKFYTIWSQIYESIEIK
jgi:alpha-N-acetylglucosamine transferase|tara:strand:+ start:373 stop:1122 length:750 start_codon:yes stop_codon:yes gene_type:complete